MKKVKSITKNTLVPIGVIVILASAFWYGGRLSARVEFNSDGIELCSAKISSLPTSTQYLYLKDAIDEVQKDVKELLKKN